MLAELPPKGIEMTSDMENQKDFRNCPLQYRCEQLGKAAGPQEDLVCSQNQGFSDLPLVPGLPSSSAPTTLWGYFKTGQIFQIVFLGIFLSEDFRLSEFVCIRSVLSGFRTLSLDTQINCRVNLLEAFKYSLQLNWGYWTYTSNKYKFRNFRCQSRCGGVLWEVRWEVSSLRNLLTVPIIFLLGSLSLFTLKLQGIRTACTQCWLL